MRLGFITIKLSKVLVLLIVLVAFSLAAVGCTSSTQQGWSGFASHEDILYFGSMNGEVLAISSSARSHNLDFPSKSDGEWSHAIKASARPSSMCGPTCGPSSLPVSIYSTPAIAGDLIYVGTYNGKIMAINRLSPGYDEEGNPSWIEKGEWRYPRGENKFIGAIVGNLVIIEDTLYVGSSDGKVYALDVVSGNEKWQFQTGGKIWTSPAIKNGVVYIGSHGDKIHALSCQDGSLLWEIELPAAIASSPVASGNKVFFGTFDHYLYAVDSANGKEKWKFKGENWFWASPVVKNNIVYAGCLDHTIYALDAGTGKVLWQFVADDPIVSTPVLVDNSLVAVSELGEMYVLDADSGVLNRIVSIGYSVLAPIHAEEGVVYIHARDHSIYCVDVKSGQIAWKFSSDVD